MIKNLKAMVLAGTVMAGAAALVPMATYAATDTATVSVTVSPTITIDAATGATFTDVTSESGTDGISTQNISVTISANKAYTISLHAAQPRLYPTVDGTANGAVNTSSNEYIPAGVPAKNTNAWGVKGYTTETSANYTALTTAAVPFYTATAGAQGAVTNFPVGISVAPSLSSGTYVTTVTITAATN